MVSLTKTIGGTVLVISHDDYSEEDRGSRAITICGVGLKIEVKAEGIFNLIIGILVSC